MDRNNHTESSLALFHGQLELIEQEHGPDFNVRPVSALLLLHRLVATLTRAEALELEPVDLNGSLFNILTVLHRHPEPMVMKDLADTLSVKPSNMTASIRDLVSRGLVARFPSPHDRRSFMAAITPAGEDLLQRLLPGHWDMIDTFFDVLEPRELTEFVDLLTRILGAITSDESPRGLNPLIVQAAQHVQPL